jgi:DnaK suppressor protein
MTPEEKKTVKTEIEKRICEAEENITTLRSQTAPVPPSVAIGRLTRMDAIQQKSMAESNLKSAEKLIFNLKLALSKLDEPGFGECAICNGSIPVERILAIPETRVCVKCASSRKR